VDIGEIEKRLDGLLAACGRNVQGDPEIEAVEEAKKSLRLVPKLLSLKEVAVEIRTMLGEGGFMDIGGDNAAAAWLATYTRLKAALAALDAGDGGK